MSTVTPTFDGTLRLETHPDGPPLRHRPHLHPESPCRAHPEGPSRTRWPVGFRPHSRPCARRRKGGLMRPFKRRTPEPVPGQFDNPTPPTTHVSPELLGLKPTVDPPPPADPCRCGPDCCCRRTT
jgi:hypothetical protein